MHVLAIITVTSPAMLWGLALLAVPIAVHRLGRRAQLSEPFASIRLLVQSKHAQTQWRRLRYWLLLAVRLLIIAALVAAFARPKWHDSPLSVDAHQKGLAVVILLDTSASTTQRPQGVDLFGVLRAAAGRTLTSLKVGKDRANIIYASSHPRAALDMLTSRFDILRSELVQANPTLDRADLPAALALARRMLLTHQGPRRLVFISDMQAENWQGVLDVWPQNGPAVTFVPVHPGASANVGLSLLRAEPSRPIVGEPVALMLCTANYATKTAVVNVAMRMDDKLTKRVTITLAPGEKRILSFAARFDQAGTHRVSFHCNRDALEIDNTAYLTIGVTKQIAVTLITHEDITDPFSAAYYVMRALVPDADRLGRVKLTVRQARQLAELDLEQCDIIVVTGADAPDDQSRRMLQTYVSKGGGMITFRPPDPASDDRVRYFAVGPRPMWRTFAPHHLDALKQIAFKRIGSVTADEERTKEVLLRFDDGSPAVMTANKKNGRIIIANFHPAPDDTDLVKFGSFAALLHSMVDNLRRGATNVNYTAGSSLRYALDAATTGSLIITGPGDTHMPVEIHETPDSSYAYVPQLASPGFYRIWQGDQVLDTIAVNIDARESNLQRLDMTQITALQTEAPPFMATGAIVAGENILQTSGRPLWGWMLAIVLAAMALELWLTKSSKS